MREGPEAARRAWLVYRAGFGFALFVGVATFTLNLIDRVGVGPLALVLTGTTLEVCYTLAEVPTGVVADRRGRKRSVLIGLVVVGCGLFLDVVPSLPVILVAQVLVGVGWTFMSGADVAWLTDEVGEEAARPLYAQGARAELWGSVVGVCLGAAAGQLSLWLPLAIAGIALVVLAAWLSVAMHESDTWRDHGTGEERMTIAETVRRTRASVRARPAVGVLLAVMVAAGLGGEGVDRLWQFHMLGHDAGDGRAVLAVAALFLGGLVGGAGLTVLVERRLAVDHDGAHARRWVAAANALIAVAVLALALGPWWLAAAGVVAAGALRHACDPLIKAWANRDADPSTRATLNSLVGQAESVGEIAGGSLGGLAASAGTAPTLVVSAATFALGGWLATWRRGEAAVEWATPTELEPAAGGGAS